MLWGLGREQNNKETGALQLRSVGILVTLDPQHPQKYIQLGRQVTEPPKTLALGSGLLRSWTPLHSVCLKVQGKNGSRSQGIEL